MGGGFKQNLNIEVSPNRIAKEVAVARKKISSNNFGYRHSRHMSDNTLDLTIAERPDEGNIGLNIEPAQINEKPANNNIPSLKDD